MATTKWSPPNSTAVVEVSDEEVAAKLEAFGFTKATGRKSSDSAKPSTSSKSRS